MTTGEKLNSSGKTILLKSVDSILISRFTCSPTFIVVVSILVVTLVVESCAKSKLNAKKSWINIDNDSLPTIFKIS